MSQDTPTEPQATKPPAGPTAAPPPPKTPPAPPKKRRKRTIGIIIFIIILVIAAIVGVLFYLHSRNFESTDDAFVDGNVTQMSPQVAGLVASVDVVDNEDVAAGQVLLTIDARDYNAALEQAQATLNAAQAREAVATTNVELVRANTGAGLSQAQAGVRQAQAEVQQEQAGVSAAESQVASAQADVVAAQAEATRRQQDLQRYLSLDPRAVSQQQRDEARAAADAANAQLAAAKKRQSAAEAAVLEAQGKVQAAQAKVASAQAAQRAAETGPQQIASAQAQVKNAQAMVAEAQAAVDAAKLNLSYTTIRAPAAGRVTRKSVMPGQYVQVGQALMAIVSADVWVTANFKETQLTHMHAGQPVDIVVDAYPDRTFKGHVQSIQAGSGAHFSLLPPENATGNYVKVVQRVPVKIVFDDNVKDRPLIAPGMSASPVVRITGDGNYPPHAVGAASAPAERSGGGTAAASAPAARASAAERADMTTLSTNAGAGDMPERSPRGAGARAATPELAEWQPTGSPWPIAAAVMAATFMEVLDTTVVNVALPHIAGSLSSSVDQSTWVLTSYLVANAIILPATGWLSSMFGRKRFLIACIIIFTIASAVCGAATSLTMLIMARVVQGAGGGALQPISQAVLLESFPMEKRGVAMAVFGMGVVVAPIIGPTLGGWMTDNYSWRWVFYINLPVGFLAVMMTQMFLEDPPYIRSQRAGSIDYWGFALLAIWVASFQIILDKGQQEDWLASAFIRTLLVIGIIGLVIFVMRELMTDEPLVNLRILKNRNFATGVLLMGLVGAILYGSIALLPLYLQELLGYSAYMSGLTTSPRGFGSIVGMILVGRLLGILDGRMLIFIGFCILTWSNWNFGHLSLDVAPTNVIWPNIWNGFGTALIFVPLTTLTMGTLRNDQMGNATGIFNLMRNLGGGIGIAIVTTFLARGVQSHQANMIAHVTPYNPVYQHQLPIIQHALSGQVGSYEGHKMAYGVLYGIVQQQASLSSYIDNFHLMTWASLLCIPAILLFKRASRKGPVNVH